MTNPKPEKDYVTEKFTQLNQDKARLMDAVAAMKKAGTNPHGTSLADAIKALYRVHDEIKNRRRL